MTVSLRSLAPCRHVLALFLALFASALSAQTPDEPDSGGTFTTPSYPPRTTTQTGNPSLPQGTGSAQQPGTTGRLPTQPGAIDNSGLPRNRTQPETTLRRTEPLPPPRPTEFQRFVEGATGRMLPIFGSTFFAQAADTFQSLDNVPVSADYTIGPGDEIVTRAWGSIDVDYRSTVDRNGMLNLPKVGSFNVAGVKAADLERNLRAQIGRLYTNFDLSVSLGQLRGLRVFIVGPAMRPGVVTLSSQSTLLSAIVAAGGPSPTGSMRKVLLRRDGKVISELDVYEFLGQGDKSKDVQLVAGDVIVFQPAGPRVAVTGSIDTPAIFELKSEQEPIRDVLRYAGGAPVLANPNRVQLERIDPSKPLAKRYVESFRLDSSGLQTPLRDGDVVTLLAISPQFANAVTLKGHVAQPLRYPFTPGMRIRDLIPDRDALITPDFYRRKNLLVQMIDDKDRIRLRDDTDRNDVAGNDRNAARTNFDGRNDAADSTQRPGTGLDTNGNATIGTQQQRGTTQNRTNFDRQSALERELNERNRLDRLSPPDDLLAIARGRRTPAALFDEVNWDYATIERLNPDLTTQVIPFDLGKAVMQGDDANNIALAPGDVVTVYSQKDVRVPVARQTRLVSLEGEINAPGIYQLQPGETLKQLLTRAGGFTPQAYVYGLELSREETRARQRENLQTAISRLETLAAVQAARDAANRRDDPTGAASTAVVSSTATQAQLTRLSRIQPNGRIALELTPEIHSIDALPDLPLESGDRINVPPRPGFVTVAGAVVNSNAFVWKPGRTAGDYLRLAGADEAADTENMFILRADGTVNSAADRRGFFGRGGLEAQVLQPGDALVVPNQLDFETWGRFLVRNLKDFAQIFSGFGIGIAAIHTLNQ
ncbi:MAG TPA: SLBB domain-containing protein [Caldimonas sp.]|nr:SLBB domain-containing protein [Caldimonas sp.]